MSSTNKEGRPVIYENSLKVAVAREYLTSKLGYSKLAIKHNLPNGETVRHFVRWYKAHYPGGEIAAVLPAGQTGQSTTREVEELRKQLQQANLKVVAWEMLLQNAGKELGVDIVKKFGTKPSGK